MVAALGSTPLAQAGIGIPQAPPARAAVTAADPPPGAGAAAFPPGPYAADSNNRPGPSIIVVV